MDWIGPTVSEPFGPFVPVQPPEAEQPSTPVVVQERMLVPPDATFVGDAVIVSVGVAAAAALSAAIVHCIVPAPWLDACT